MSWGICKTIKSTSLSRNTNIVTCVICTLHFRSHTRVGFSKITWLLKNPTNNRWHILRVLATKKLFPWHDCGVAKRSFHKFPRFVLLIPLLDVSKTNYTILRKRPHQTEEINCKRNINKTHKRLGHPNIDLD